MTVVRLLQSAEVFPFYILHFTFRPWKNRRRGVLSLAILLLAASAFAAEQDDATAKLVTPAADRADRARAQMAGRSQHDDGSFGAGQFRWKRGRHGPGGHGHDGRRQHARPRAATAGRSTAASITSSANAQPSGFIAGRRREPRPHVRPRLRHHVPGRVLRHVAAGRAAREAGQGRQADRQHPEQGGRLAIPAVARGGRRHLGHRLRGDGPAGRPERRALRAQRDDRSLDRLPQTQPERRWRLQVHAPRRRKCLPAVRRRRGGA